MTHKSLFGILVTSPLLSIIALLLCGTSKTSAQQGWQQCPGGGVCPEYATCCPSSTPGSPPACISRQEGKDPENSTGICCDETTGCPYGFSCGVRTSITPDELWPRNDTEQAHDDAYAFQNQTESLYCKIDTENPPADVFHDQPRYELCRIPDRSMTIMHGFPIFQMNDTTNHQRRVRIRQRRILSSADTNHLAYYSSHGDLIKLNSNDGNETDEGLPINHTMIEKVLIMIHGSLRDAEDYFCVALSLVPKAERDRVLVIAPKFMAPADLVDDNTTRYLMWQEEKDRPKYPLAHSWRYGADALNAPVSSYAAIDGIVEYLLSSSSENGKRLFPNLNQVSLAGHSAGGQAVHRWALLSKIDPKDVEIRIVAANPRSFCYLDGRRMIHTNGTTRFDYPSAQHLEHCPDYNRWSWGLEQGGALDLVVPYFVRRLEETTPEELAMAYGRRRVVYLTGEYDIILKKDHCATHKLQGKNRLKRALHYFAALKGYFEGLEQELNHDLYTIPESPHDHVLMFQNTAAREAIFGSSDDIEIPSP